MTFWIVAAVVVVVGFALAWWSSGRSRLRSRLPGQTKLANENRALREHRPSDNGWSGIG